MLRPQVAILEATSLAATLTVPSAWANAVSGSWSIPSKWTAGAPNLVGAGAVIDVATTAALTVTLNEPVTIGTLLLGNPVSTTAGYTLSGSGGNTLTFSNSGNGATIMVAGGSQVIDAPVVLADNLIVSGSGTLAFGGGSIKESGSHLLTMSGDGGTLILSGTDNYSGTIVTAGTLDAISSIALPGGSSLTVGAGGTFIFGPAVAGAR